MLITYTATYEARDMKDALAQATRRWRALVDDTEAELPWGATLRISENGHDDLREVELNVSTDR